MRLAGADWAVEDEVLVIPDELAVLQIFHATKASLDKAGLLYSNISPEVHSGQLEITGYTRCYGTPEGGWGPMGDKYKGKSFRFF